MSSRTLYRVDDIIKSCMCCPLWFSVNHISNPDRIFSLFILFNTSVLMKYVLEDLSKILLKMMILKQEYMHHCRPIKHKRQIGLGILFILMLNLFYMYILDARINGIPYSNGLWFYNIRGVFQAVFEYCDIQTQKFCLLHLRVMS